MRRRFGAVVWLPVASIVLTACGAGDASGESGAALASDKGAAKTVLQARVDKTLAEGVSAFRVSVGDFSLGVDGKFDLQAGVHESATYFSDLVDNEGVNYSLQRRFVGDGAFLRVQEEGKDDACWRDVTNDLPFDTAAGRTPEVVRLIESLEGVSVGASGVDFEATVPIDALVDAMLGGFEGFEGPVTGISNASVTKDIEVRVPVAVRAGAESVSLIRADADGIVKALDSAGVDVADAFGLDFSRSDFLKIKDVSILLTSFGYPVRIERPLPTEIGIASTDKCA